MGCFPKRNNLHIQRTAAVPGIILFLFFLLFLPVFAGPLDFLTSVAKDMISGMLEGVLDDSAISILTGGAGAAGGGFGIAQNIMRNVIQPIATAIVSLCFAVKLAHVAADFEHITAERFFTPCLQCAGCLYLVNHTSTIMNTLVNIGSGVATSVRNQTAGLLSQNAADRLSSMAPNLDSGSLLAYFNELWKAARAVLVLAIPYLLFRIIQLLIKVACYGIVIEICVRAVMFPLFIGDVMLHGFDGRGFQVAKSFAASCLQCAAMIIIAAVANGMCIAAIPGGGGNDVGQFAEAVLKILVYDFSAFSLMMKAGDITKDALGAR